MQHSEMVALIRSGVTQQGGVWADLGAGTGNFTFALRELLSPGASIHAIDRDARAIASLNTRIAAEPQGAQILPKQVDVTNNLKLPPLDGILMANLLHFIRDQVGFLTRLSSQLQPTGRLLIVEYEQRLPIPWVPYPVSFERLGELARTAGLGEVRQVGTRTSPSSGQVMYAATVAR